MAVVRWQVLRTQRCPHIGVPVRLEARVVYPARWLPEQPPRVTAHRCSHAEQCRTSFRPGCRWSGGEPLHDPFRVG